MSEESLSELSFCRTVSLVSALFVRGKGLFQMSFKIFPIVSVAKWLMVESFGGLAETCLEGGSGMPVPHT